MPESRTAVVGARFLSGSMPGGHVISIGFCAKGLELLCPDGRELVIPWELVSLECSDSSNLLIHINDDRIAGPVETSQVEAFLARYQMHVDTIGAARRVERIWTLLKKKQARSPWFHAVLASGVLFLAVLAWQAVGLFEYLLVHRLIPPSLEESIGESLEEAFVGERPRAGGEHDIEIARIGKLLWKYLELEKEPIIHVIIDGRINAYALPGGRIIVYTGLIEKTRSVDELAGILAHELSHTVHKDSMSRLVSQVKWHLLYAYLSGDLSATDQYMLKKAASLAVLRYSRKVERRADMEAVELLAKAGFRPAALPGFFERLSSGGESFFELPVLSDHPGNSSRVRYLRRLVDKIKKPGIKCKSGESRAAALAAWNNLREFTAGRR